jgi:hypothetical protein
LPFVQGTVFVGVRRLSARHAKQANLDLLNEKDEDGLDRVAVLGESCDEGSLTEDAELQAANARGQKR